MKLLLPQHGIPANVTFAPAAAPPSIRVLAFDPGSTKMGWALICYDLEQCSAIVPKHGLLTGQHLLKERKELQHKFSKAFIILEVYYHIFCRLIETHRPDFVVTEGAFYYRFVQAYASLTLVIHTLRRACHDTLGRDLHEVAPMETKKLVTGISMADKDQIKAALLARANLTIDDTEDAPLAEMSEHEYDAVGHGLTFIARADPYLLLAQAIAKK